MHKAEDMTMQWLSMISATLQALHINRQKMRWIYWVSFARASSYKSLAIKGITNSFKRTFGLFNSELPANHKPLDFYTWVKKGFLSSQENTYMHIGICLNENHTY